MAVDLAPAPRVTETRKATFRPDVQGIRALAVLLVIVNHLSPHRLPGGYVGVDVFFVISGYLITRLLMGESERTGGISLRGFYARRARRIIPAATAATIATVVVSLLTLPLLRVQEILEDAVWTTFFAANVRMAHVGTDYFAIGQPPSPFRHFWSLAVEEQFYLVWPALLVLCLLVLRRRGGASPERFRLVAEVIICIVAAASLVWAVWATYHSPVTAYFSTLARADELAIGAACAVAAHRVRLQPAARQLVAVAGLAAVAAAALLFTAATPFPGWVVLVPVLGTAALVVAGESTSTPSTAVGRALAVAPLVVIGDWSYSLYLWHWPIIVLLRSNLGVARFDTPPVRVATLALVIVVGWASYRWIEQPFRRGRTWRRPTRALLIYPVSIAAVLTLVAVGTRVLDFQLGHIANGPETVADYGGAKLGKDPYVALVKASVLAARHHRPVPGHLMPGLVNLREQTAPLGDCDYRTGTTKLCATGDVASDYAIVVFGDSHARALSPAVERLGEKYGYRVYALVYSGCAANNLVQIDRDTGRSWGACEDFKAWAESTIAQMHPDLVVVSTHAGKVVDPQTGHYLSRGGDGDYYRQVLQQGWAELFESLRGNAGQVYVVGNTPKLPRETGVCLSQGHPDLGDCAFAPTAQSTREAETSFRAARTAGVGVVDAQKWFCADGLCPSVIGTFITMRDSEHMTPDYARWLATPLAEAMHVAGG